MSCAFLTQKCLSLGDDAKLGYILGLLHGDFEPNGNLGMRVVNLLKNATDEQLARVKQVLYHGKTELAYDIDQLVFEHKLDKNESGVIDANLIFAKACAVGVESIVRAFLSNPDFDFASHVQTGLALATHAKHLPIIELLLGDERLSTEHFLNVLNYVAQSRDHKLINSFFHCEGIPIAKLHVDILETSLDTFKELIDMIDGDSVFDFQKMLIEAVKYKKQDYVEYLVDCQQVDVAADDHLALREAAKRNFVEIFDFLLSRLAAADCDCHRTVGDLYTDSQKRKRARDESLEQAVAARIGRQKRLFRDRTVYYWRPDQRAFFEGVIYAQNNLKVTVTFANGDTRYLPKSTLVRALPEPADSYAVGEEVLVRRALPRDRGVVSWWTAAVTHSQGDRYAVQWTCLLDDGESETWLCKQKEMRPIIKMEK